MDIDDDRDAQFLRCSTAPGRYVAQNSADQLGRVWKAKCSLNAIQKEA
jgi:hypothetical protein